MVRTWDFTPSEEKPPAAGDGSGALCLRSEASHPDCCGEGSSPVRGERKVAGAHVSIVGRELGRDSGHDVQTGRGHPDGGDMARGVLRTEGSSWPRHPKTLPFKEPEGRRADDSEEAAGEKRVTEVGHCARRAT